MKAVKRDGDWQLAFPLGRQEFETERPDLDDATKFVWREWPHTEGYVANEEGLVACKIYKTLPARRVWDVIMSSTYDFAEPGFILDRPGQRDEQQLVDARTSAPPIPAASSRCRRTARASWDR